MIEGQLYRVGVRRLISRPGTVSYERLRFAGLNGGKTCWMPEHDGWGTKRQEMDLSMIASIEEAA